jgi:hypothetical protein
LPIDEASVDFFVGVGWLACSRGSTIVGLDGSIAPGFAGRLWPDGEFDFTSPVRSD